MRFLLYNIRYAAGTGTHFHLPLPYAGYLKRSTRNLDKIVSFIKSVRPDIVGLVEVDSGSFRSDKHCQAEVIAQALDYHHLVETKYGIDSMANRLPLLNKQGNALLTRQPIVSYHYHYFDQGVKRLIIEARVDDLTIFLVHLSLTYRKRQYQLEQLYHLIRQVDGPLIVAGDFNVLWGDRELELFLAATGLLSANNEGAPSHPSRSPKRQLDFILHSSELVVTDFRVPSVTLSDHAPLLCDFTRVGVAESSLQPA